MPRINYTTITNDFIKDGFFSEYLPPCFSIYDDFEPCSVSLADANDYIEPMSFNMSRFTEDGKRRTIYIPEFASYIKVVKYMKDNDLVKDIITLSNSQHSFSPLIQKNGDLTRHERCYNYGITIDDADQDAFKSTYIPNIVEKICRGKGAKGVLSLDIANFYPSIYTHLIPCIKLGYEDAEKQYKMTKANNADPNIKDEYRKYVCLDEFIRNMNVGRTNGILPGTLISQFVAEAILSRIDNDLEELGINFVRYVDDFEIYIYNEQEIHKIQNDVSKILNKYSLTLNNEKTKYNPFPYYVIENLEKIYYEYLERISDETDFMELFNKFLKLESNGTKGAIRFLVKSLSETFTSPNDELFLSYLFNILVNDSRSLVKVCELLIERNVELTNNSDNVKLIENLIEKNVIDNNQLETVWLLYLRKKLFNKKISTKLGNMIATSNNELAKLILIEEFGRNLTKTAKRKIIESASSWLLCYQLFYHNHITKEEFSNKTHISKNLSFYARLKRKNFSFYKIEN